MQTRDHEDCLRKESGQTVQMRDRRREDYLKGRVSSDSAMVCLLKMKKLSARQCQTVSKYVEENKDGEDDEPERFLRDKTS